MTIADYFKGKVTYDNEGQYFWITKPNGEITMLGELRGWGRIQQFFKKNGQIDMKKAAAFQDEIGEFVAQAINEKLEK